MSYGKQSVVFALLLLGAFSVSGHAHQPRLVYGVESTLDNPISVPEPQVSKAYYGELSGAPAFYKISSGDTFDFYVSVLSADLAGYNRTDYSVEVRDSKGVLVLLLNGTSNQWNRFYEEYGGDWYMQGPEGRARLPKGGYTIKLYNPENAGRYSLAIGEKESFPPEEMINAFVLVPQIKQKFFGKSLFEAYGNIYGMTVLMIVLLVASMFYAAYRALKSAQEKQV
jgi:hypothetical protein